MQQALHLWLSWLRASWHKNSAKASIRSEHDKTPCGRRIPDGRVFFVEVILRGGKFKKMVARVMGEQDFIIKQEFMPGTKHILYTVEEKIL